MHIAQWVHICITFHLSVSLDLTKIRLENNSGEKNTDIAVLNPLPILDLLVVESR